MEMTEGNDNGDYDRCGGSESNKRSGWGGVSGGNNLVCKRVNGLDLYLIYNIQATLDKICVT